MPTALAHYDFFTGLRLTDTIQHLNAVFKLLVPDNKKGHLIA